MSLASLRVGAEEFGKNSNFRMNFHSTHSPRTSVRRCSTDSVIACMGEESLLVCT